MTGGVKLSALNMIGLIGIKDLYLGSADLSALKIFVSVLVWSGAISPSEYLLFRF